MNVLLHNGYKALTVSARMQNGSYTAIGAVQNIRTGFSIPFATCERHATADAALRAGVGWIKKKIDGTW